MKKITFKSVTLAGLFACALGLSSLADAQANITRRTHHGTVNRAVHRTWARHGNTTRIVKSIVRRTPTRTTTVRHVTLRRAPTHQYTATRHPVPVRRAIVHRSTPVHRTYVRHDNGLHRGWAIGKGNPHRTVSTVRRAWHPTTTRQVALAARTVHHPSTYYRRTVQKAHDGRTQRLVHTTRRVVRHHN